MFFWRRKSTPPAMTLEGALGPNDRLESAAAARVEAPDALVVAADGRLLVSSGARVLALAAWGEAPGLWAEFAAPVTALAASPGGRVAIGLRGGGLELRERDGRPSPGWGAPAGLKSVVDAMFLSEDELAIVDFGFGADEPVLSIAPWDDVGRGRLWAIPRQGPPRVLVEGLWCPMGVGRDAEGGLVVSEFERARIVGLDGRVRQAGLPGYLGRFAKTEAGYLLTCLSRRDPLIEFLKTEREFVKDMKARTPPSHWIAPRLDPQFRHDLPIELGATRLFGEVKPWAPSFSYGLVIELDARFSPLGSWQSRAHGRRHAISAALVWNGDIVAVSKASGELLKLDREARR